MLLSIPVVGSWLQYLAFGGPFPGAELEQRIYAAHILLVPGIILALITLHMAILVRQKHTHFPGPGRSDSNVVGSRLWPTYAFRSISLQSAVLAVCFGLGGLVQINPIWLWGPFNPAAVTSPAQPDWYVGWLDGALRLFPPWEFRIAGYLVPSVFWPAVVLPGAAFVVIYAWPWIERVATGDRAEHHVLMPTRETPGRVAIGAGALTFFGLLLLAGANDLAARLWRVPVLTIVWAMRIATVVMPFVVALTVLFVTRRLRRSEVPHLSDLPASALQPTARKANRPADRADAPPAPIQVRDGEEPLEEGGDEPPERFVPPPHTEVRPQDAPEPLATRGRS